MDLTPVQGKPSSISPSSLVCCKLAPWFHWRKGRGGVSGLVVCTSTGPLSPCVGEILQKLFFPTCRVTEGQKRKNTNPSIPRIVVLYTHGMLSVRLKYPAPGDIRLWQKHHCQPQIKSDSWPLSRRVSLKTP